MGGQTGLNTAMDLAHHGVLEKYNVELIGAREEVIEKAEERDKFKQAMANIGLEVPEASSFITWKTRVPHGGSRSAVDYSRQLYARRESAVPLPTIATS